MTTRSAPPLPVGPHGERSAGVEGDVPALASCRVPPPDPAPGWSKPSARCSRRWRDVTVKRWSASPRRSSSSASPGQLDLDRAGFLHAVAATPGEILAIDGEHEVAYRADDLGVVRGVQVARVRLDSTLIEDRGAFGFERRGGAWRLSLALNVPIRAPVP